MKIKTWECHSRDSGFVKCSEEDFNELISRDDVKPYSNGNCLDHRGRVKKIRYSEFINSHTGKPVARLEKSECGACMTFKWERLNCD